VYIVAVII